MNKLLTGPAAALKEEVAPQVVRGKWRVAACIVLFLVPLYVLTASGTFLGNADSVFMYGVTETLATSGGLAISDHAVALQSGGDTSSFAHLKGTDGRLYFPKGIAFSLTLVPFYWLGEGLAHLNATLAEEPWHGVVTMLTASLANPLFASFECVLIFLTLLEFRVSRLGALFIALSAGVGTIIWSDAKSNMSEPSLGLALSLAYYATVRIRNMLSWTWSSVLGAALAFLILDQPAFVALAPAVFVPVVALICLRQPSNRRKQSVLCMLCLLVGIGLGGLLLGWANQVRYGSISSSGYDSFVQFDYPIIIGLFGLLFSPGKSLFLYSPLLLVSLGVTVPFVRRVGFIGVVPLALLAVFVAFYARVPYWGGDGAWGSRYLTPLTGCLVLPASALLYSKDAGLRRIFVWLGAVLVGLGVQIVGITTSTAAYFALLIRAGILTTVDYGALGWSPVLFHPAFSPIVGRTHLFMSGLFRLATGQSMTWIPLPGLRLDLTDYDIIPVWPALLYANGMTQTFTVGVLVIGAVVVLGLTWLGGILLMARTVAELLRADELVSAGSTSTFDLASLQSFEGLAVAEN